MSLGRNQFPPKLRGAFGTLRRRARYGRPKPGSRAAATTAAGWVARYVGMATESGTVRVLTTDHQVQERRKKLRDSGLTLLTEEFPNADLSDSYAVFKNAIVPNTKDGDSVTGVAGLVAHASARTPPAPGSSGSPPTRIRSPRPVLYAARRRRRPGAERRPNELQPPDRDQDDDGRADGRSTRWGPSVNRTEIPVRTRQRWRDRADRPRPAPLPPCSVLPCGAAVGADDRVIRFTAAAMVAGVESRVTHTRVALGSRRS